MMSRLISPKLMQTLQQDFFPLLCSIQKPVKSQSTSGQEIKTWTDMPALGNIPCRVKATGGDERRLPNEIYAITTHRIALAGVFAELKSEMRAVVNGTVYDILLPEVDSEGFATYLNVRVVK